MKHDPSAQVPCNSLKRGKTQFVGAGPDSSCTLRLDVARDLGVYFPLPAVHKLYVAGDEGTHTSTKQAHWRHVTPRHLPGGSGTEP